MSDLNSYKELYVQFKLKLFMTLCKLEAKSDRSIRSAYVSEYNIPELKSIYKSGLVDEELTDDVLMFLYKYNLNYIEDKRNSVIGYAWQFSERAKHLDTWKLTPNEKSVGKGAYTSYLLVDEGEVINKLAKPFFLLLGSPGNKSAELELRIKRVKHLIWKEEIDKKIQDLNNGTTP